MRRNRISSDFNELLKLFNDRGVRYLVVGGHAVMLYTEPRYTKDLDLWVDADPDNAARTYAALAEFGAPLKGIRPEDFARREYFYQLGRPPLRVDILTSVDGVDFTDAWRSREEAPLGSQTVPIIGRDDLIKNKKAVGRHIDLHDVELLDKSRTIEEE